MGHKANKMDEIENNHEKLVYLPKSDANPPHLCWLASLVAGWLTESYEISILIINQKIIQKPSCSYYFSEYSIVLSHGQNKTHF